MTPLCRRCRELVDPHDRLCASCGADLKVQVPVLVDLTAPGAEAEREREALLASVLSATAAAEPPAPRPGWVGHAPTMLALEHDTVRLGRASATTDEPSLDAHRSTIDDVLPAPAPARRGWRRR